VDGGDQVQARLQHFQADDLHPGLLASLQTLLMEHNHYVQQYIQVKMCHLHVYTQHILPMCSYIASMNVGLTQYVHHTRLQACDIPNNEVNEYEIVFRENTVQRRRYNAPTAGEVAAFIPGTEDEDVRRREVRVTMRATTGNEGMTRIPVSHPAYDPLHFVLFHPNGEAGWHWDMKKVSIALQLPHNPCTAAAA